MIHFFKWAIICISLGLGSMTACIASEIDVSKWGYDDLVPTAMEMVADKNYNGALQLLDLAVHTNPNYPEAYINRGAILGELHQKEKAIQDEQKAISLAKNSGKKDINFRCLAHQNLSGIYLINKEFDKAEVEAGLAVKLCPTDPRAQEKLGDILEKNGKLQEALFHFNKAKYFYDKNELYKRMQELDHKISQLQARLR